MELKGSVTEGNLLEALKGESVARNKYTFYASVAKKEGYRQISEIFLQTAENERAHAKIWFKQLGLLGDTAFNLKECIKGEHYETATMYPEFAKVAKEEGFNDIAKLFEGVGAIEAHHEERYKDLLENIEDGRVFKRDEPKKWICMECGDIYYGEEPPAVCPVCDHPIAHREIWVRNY